MKKIILFLIIGTLVLNGLSAEAINRSEEKNEQYDMVIIAPMQFYPPVQKLINHKINHDIQTVFKSTQSIYREFNGRDDAESIKFFIKEAIEKWDITYVLLMGGRSSLYPKWHIPVRYVLLDDDTGRYTKLFSDHYYSDIYKEGGEFEDWDSNGDDVIAEWGKDQMDLLPDVCVGRLPCRNYMEARVVVQKIIDYENNANGAEWFKNLVLIGGDTFNQTPGYEGEETCDYAAGFMDGFEKIKLYTSTGDLTGPEEVTDAINNGCGFLFTRGKGGQDRLRTSLPEGDEIIVFHNKYVKNYKNKGMYPVCILGECIHAKLDVALLNIFKFTNGEPNYFIQDCIYECIAWKLVKKNNGGAIAVLTNTNICYGTSGDLNGNGIPDDAESFGGKLAVDVLRFYGEENITTLGDIHMQTVKDYVSGFPVSTNKYHCKSVIEWILIGDPSLKIGGY
ncbi:MAG: hypothetical protein AYK22_08320 [Thermoplasmatales archaeon SG8-52-3]|nr:MAG: hypothetical protein AYK22_08320 [Thermoplasmatales archaeon SG8-52-3]